MPIRKFLPADHHFEPETLSVLERAFETVCRDLDDTAEQPVSVKEAIAYRMIAAAAEGVRDLDALIAEGRRSPKLAYKKPALG